MLESGFDHADTPNPDPEGSTEEALYGLARGLRSPLKLLADFCSGLPRALRKHGTWPNLSLSPRAGTFERSAAKRYRGARKFL